MMNDKRSTRRSRNARVDTDGFSGDARKSRRESQPLRYDSFDSSRYGQQSRDGSYASAYSRRVSQAEYTKQRQKRKRKKTSLVVLSVILVVLLGGAGAAFAYYNTISDNLKRNLDPALQDVLVKTDLAKEPFYILLMGVDSSEERANSDEYAGDPGRSDTIMLARVDPVNMKLTLVSLHRDILVDMGDEYGQNKLNAAHALGGPSLAVKAVSDLAGVPISHYAEVDFDGFRDAVNALGGIEVDVPMEIQDDMAGGYLAAGPQTLNGDQALILCRSRHAYDDIGPGDTFRAANQRLVLSAIVKKILAADIVTMTSTVASLSNYLTTDLAIPDIIGLAQAMKDLNSETDIYSAMTPTEAQYIGGVWYEIIDVAAWKTMMSRVEQGLPPTEEDIVDEVSGTVLATTGSGEGGSGSSAKKSGSVAVKNGSNIQGAASEAGNKLKALGYTIATGNADSSDYAATIVVYQSASQEDDAKNIVTTLSKGTIYLNDGTYVFDGDFLVVIGADWA